MRKIKEEDNLAEKLSNWILKSQYLVAFTGAGISTESGLSDFRGKDGVWTRRDKGLPPVPSPKFDDVKPNDAHMFLVELQKRGILKFLISQNVDNLHLHSGINPSLLAELHGNYTKVKCIECDTRFKKNEVGWDREIHGAGFRTEPAQENQPLCGVCGGRLISSVVNFNDPMPIQEVKLAKDHSLKCDLMLVIGSSLSVYPAANYPKLAKKNGAKLVIINIDPTGLDDLADLKIQKKAGEFLSDVLKIIKMSS